FFLVRCLFIWNLLMKKNFGGEKMNNQSLGKKFDRQALLFEHGISESQIIASIQNKVDPLAKRIIDYHQNRLMIKIIYELKIKIETHESFSKGIIHIVQATSLKPLR